MIHWNITQTYLKVSFETKQILDLKVLLNNTEKHTTIKSFQDRMKIANIVNPLLIVGLSVSAYIGMDYGNGLAYSFGGYVLI